jgi:hypothetical protein
VGVSAKGSPADMSPRRGPAPPRESPSKGFNVDMLKLAFQRDQIRFMWTPVTSSSSSVVHLLGSIRSSSDA